MNGLLFSHNCGGLAFLHVKQQTGKPDLLVWYRTSFLKQAVSALLILAKKILLLILYLVDR